MKYLATALVVGALLFLAHLGSLRGWFGRVATTSLGSTGTWNEVDRRTPRQRSVVLAADGRTESAGGAGPRPANGADRVAARIVSVDPLARDVTVDIGEATRVIHVGIGVPIRCDGVLVGFDRLRPRLRLWIAVAGEGSLARLLSIEIDPRSV